jgi:ribosomal protein S11
MNKSNGKNLIILLAAGALLAGCNDGSNVSSSLSSQDLSSSDTQESSTSASQESSTSTSQESSTSEGIKYALTLNFNKDYLSITDESGAALLSEYSDGTNLKFKVSVTNIAYDNLVVTANDAALTPTEGIYAVTISSNTTIAATADLVTYTLSCTYDATILKVTSNDDKALKDSYSRGTILSFKVSLLDATYGTVVVKANDAAISAKDGFYSVTFDKNITIKVTASKITYLVTSNNDNVTIKFTDKDGVELASQKGVYDKGTDVYFKLLAGESGSYFALHDFVIKNGTTTITPTNGVYSISSITSNVVLNVVANEHVFGEDGVCATCGKNYKDLLFVAETSTGAIARTDDDYSITGTEENIYFTIGASMANYLISKGQSSIILIFKNSAAVASTTWKQVQIGYGDETASMSSYITAPDLYDGVTKTISLTADTDIRFMTDKCTGCTLSISVVSKPALDQYVEALYDSDLNDKKGGYDCGVAYTEGKGWKATATGEAAYNFIIPEKVMLYENLIGMKNLKLTFSGAFDDSTYAGNPVNCTIWILPRKTAGGDDWTYKNCFISGLTDNGDGTYSHTIDLTDTTYDFANHDLRIRVNYADVNSNAVGACYIKGIEFSA